MTPELEERYGERRERVMARFEDSDDVIFLRGSSQLEMTADITYWFRQEPNLQYLSGIQEPDAAMLLIPRERKYILFAKEYSEMEQVVAGPKESLEELGNRYGADEVYPLHSLRDVVESYNPSAIHSVRGAGSPFRYKWRRLAQVLFDMRVVKDESEIVSIESALDLTAEAFNLLMRNTLPGRNERELEAMVEYVWRANGAELAFPSIVTGKGEILHSMGNGRELRENEMLLVDIGCRTEGYCSDITRSWPVNGGFSPMQADIYDIVLEAKRSALERVGPGVDFYDIHLRSEFIIARGLHDLGILKADPQMCVASGATRLFYLHSLGHWLGIEPHDCAEFVATLDGSLMRSTLRENQVITLEPGVYFNTRILSDEASQHRFKKFVDFERAFAFAEEVSGIRLEDDVLVTLDGGKVLGPGIPEEREELEELIGTGASLP